MARRLHVAVAQVNSRACEVRANMERMKRQLRSAREAGAEAILFAETSVHGYSFAPENRALAEGLDGTICTTLREWADECDMHVLAGILEREGDEIFNSHVVVRPDGAVIAQRKHNLTDPELEVGVSAAGRERALFEIGGIRCAVLVCQDTGTEGIREEVKRAGVEFLFIPTAGGGALSDMLHETDLQTEAGRVAYVEDRARVFKPEAIMLDAWIPFASANALGFDGRDACHRGHCMIVDRFGVVRAQIPGTNVLEHQQDQMAHAILSFP